MPSSQNQEQPSTDEMPQSTAIQEKLKRFEQTTTTKSDAKSPFSLSNHHAELSQRESTKLGRALIDENKKVNTILFFFFFYRQKRKFNDYLKGFKK